MTAAQVPDEKRQQGHTARRCSLLRDAWHIALTSLPEDMAPAASERGSSMTSNISRPSGSPRRKSTTEWLCYLIVRDGI